LSTEPSRLSPFQKLVNIAAGLYLLFILAYLLARFIIQDGFWFVALLNSFAFVLFLPLPLLLILALLSRSRRAFVRLLPVVVVVLLWFGPRWLPKATADIPPDLRVMTNNVWHWNRTPEAVVALIQATRPDVVLLQEVDPATQGAALAALDAAYPYQERLTDSIRAGMYTAVNITLSRYPFVVSEIVQLDSASMPAIWRNVIEVEEQRVAVYNVHLTSPVGPPRIPIGDNYFAQVALGFDDTERNRQIDALLAYLDTEIYPYIVGGDFNMGDLSMTYTRVASQMRDSFGEAGYGYGGTWPVTEALGLPDFLPPFMRMDYLWHSDALKPLSAWLSHYVGGDHLPVLADFAFS
jgi:vancomycin resistance protein VanJ